jgi:hypothetical protein
MYRKSIRRASSGEIVHSRTPKERFARPSNLLRKLTDRGWFVVALQVLVFSRTFPTLTQKEWGHGSKGHRASPMAPMDRGVPSVHGDTEAAYTSADLVSDQDPLGSLGPMCLGDLELLRRTFEETIINLNLSSINNNQTQSIFNLTCNPLLCLSGPTGP